MRSYKKFKSMNEPTVDSNEVTSISSSDCNIDINVNKDIVHLEDASNGQLQHDNSTANMQIIINLIPPENEIHAVEHVTSESIATPSPTCEMADAVSPRSIIDNVKLVVQKWGRVTAIPPDIFLIKVLQSRGYPCDMIPSSPQVRKPPSTQQLYDYDSELIAAVRHSDLNKLTKLHTSGKSMSACNKFSESIVHMACRRSDFKIIDFILKNGGSLNIIDDYGRTPLHDACWSTEPRFDVVTLLLDYNVNLLRVCDVRGSTPLNYVRQEHWLEWCAFIFYLREKYWQPIVPCEPATDDNEYAASTVSF